MALAVIGLTGCARPYDPAEKILNQEVVKPNSAHPQTKVTITRNKQFIASASGGTCKFLISIDGKDIALLRQNQFVSAYINNGPHRLKVSNECTTLSMGMRKTLDIVADGTPQEYVTEQGAWGNIECGKLNSKKLT
ncbi:hypothetical protein AAFL31_02975 [Klebsiella huaxiensis]|uniref:hypothetical protein n=1 Tax=Klebsiella huaxiensis TaxID=2153354 RepID=UPI003168CAF1